MKIAFTEKIISPPVGTRVAGYGPDDPSVAKLDDLYLSLLLLDDGRKTVMIASFDLLGLNENWIKQLRGEAVALFGGDEGDFILSCTHTHSGPNTRSLAGYPQVLERAYLQELTRITLAAAAELLQQPRCDTDVFFFSTQCEKNRNRRYISADNRASYLPYDRNLEKLCDGICDRELGGLFFAEADTGKIVYVLGNFAAHPLAGHAPGIGGHRISADFPGAFRKYLQQEIGCTCMYISGAAGDLVPDGHETGRAAIEKVCVDLATQAIAAIITAQRNPDRFRLDQEILQTGTERCRCRVRPHKKPVLYPEYAGQDEVELEIQLLSIGEICLIGVPGELLTELGLEMKWHSPFRKTFILYCSTAYFTYLCHGNALLSGGYEGDSQLLDSRAGLQLVNTAIDGAYRLYQRTFPHPEQWPENRHAPLLAFKMV